MIDRAEKKFHDAAVELLKDTKRNFHVEINAEHENESVKIKSQFSRTFKKN